MISDNAIRRSTLNGTRLNKQSGISRAKAERKPILVTGCAGFIGSHLAEALLNKGYEVWGVDNFLTGDRQNIELLKRYPRFHFIKLDLTSPATAQKLKRLNAQIIAHLASPASPPDYQKFWRETMLVNSVGTLALLELARKNGARFVFASTSEVYGDPKQHPQQESYWGNVNPYGPRSMYDEAKRFAEALIFNYRRKFGTNTGIVRIFNTYGPRMRPEDGRVVINFLTQALRGKPLTIHGDGRQTRAFCYIDDMVAGLIKMLESKVEGPINLGNPAEFSVNELAGKIEVIVGKKLQKVFLPRPEDDPNERQPDITLAKKLLGWKPNVELGEGLKKTFKWLRTAKIRDNS